MLIRSYLSVTVVISASGSSCRQRSDQRASAESLPPLQERAKDAYGLSPGEAATSRRGESPGLASIVCPLTKTSASAEEEARRPAPPEPPFLRGLTFATAQSGRPDSSPSGASQLRDSAGFTPDFAASAPAGSYLPDAPSIAPAVVDGSARFGLTTRRSPVKVARSSPVGLRVRRTWRFKEIDPLLHREWHDRAALALEWRDIDLGA